MDSDKGNSLAARLYEQSKKFSTKKGTRTSTQAKRRTSKRDILKKQSIFISLRNEASNELEKIEEQIKIEKDVAKKLEKNMTKKLKKDWNNLENYTREINKLKTRVDKYMVKKEWSKIQEVKKKLKSLLDDREYDRTLKSLQDTKMLLQLNKDIFQDHIKTRDILKESIAKSEIIK
jgi:hypothetical protein